MNRHINKLLTSPLFCALLCLPALGSADFRFDQARNYANGDKGSPGMSSDQQQGWKNTPQNPSQPNMNKDQDHTRGHPTPSGQNAYSRMNWNYPQSYSRADQYQMNFNDEFRSRPNSFFGSDQNPPSEGEEYHNRPGSHDQNQNPHAGYQYQAWYAHEGDPYNQGMPDHGMPDQGMSDHGMPDHGMSDPSQMNFASGQTRYFPGNSYYSSGADMNGDGVVSPSERKNYRPSLYSSYTRSPSNSNYSNRYSPNDYYSGNQMYGSSYSYPSNSNYSNGYSPNDYYSGNQMYGSSYSYPSDSNYSYGNSPNEYFSGDQSYDSGSYPYSQYYNDDSGMNGGYYFNFR